jgi:non-ribosomal peptide synthetase component F
LIVAILGVLKAGKIYMPLDPRLPCARLSYILEDTQAGLIVANKENFPLTAALASLLYTSGSTGQPKGVVEKHRNVLLSLTRIPRFPAAWCPWAIRSRTTRQGGPPGAPGTRPSQT